MIDGRGDREHECRGDLVARERRGDLSDADRIALDAHLAACASCRMSRNIQADFAADSAVEVDDAERIARMSAAARRWSQRRARPPARWPRRASRIKMRTLMLSMGALLIAGTASATMWWWRVTPQLSEPPAETRTPVTSPRPRVFPRARARAPEPMIAEPVAIEEPALTPAAEAYRRPRPHTRSVMVRTPPETPASLLRLASEARARGDADAASSLYRRLQREFGDTREAALSSVPWGGILLRQGQAERALEQFDRYLKSQPRGNLLPEALYGRGRALAALGRTADEKQTWRRLLSETPGSAYDSHARRRLDELK
jgi:tetratricopeptide (TPR) repeat protein